MPTTKKKSKTTGWETYHGVPWCWRRPKGYRHDYLPKSGAKAHRIVARRGSVLKMACGREWPEAKLLCAGEERARCADCATITEA